MILFRFILCQINSLWFNCQKQNSFILWEKLTATFIWYSIDLFFKYNFNAMYIVFEWCWLLSPLLVNPLLHSPPCTSLVKWFCMCFRSNDVVSYWKFEMLQNHTMILNTINEKEHLFSIVNRSLCFCHTNVFIFACISTLSISCVRV